MTDVTTFWTPTVFAHVTGGRWLAPPTDAAAPIAGLTIDSRTLQPGEAFLAIAGERFDGHVFVAQARSAGAAMAIVEQDLPVPAETDDAALRCCGSSRPSPRCMRSRFSGGPCCALPVAASSASAAAMARPRPVTSSIRF